MVRWKRLMLLALPTSLLSVPMARGDTPSSSPGITRDDQREERFYNFDNGRQSGGGFKDPSDLIRKLQGARNLQRATEPTDALDTALDGFTWPDEEGDTDDPCLVWTPPCLYPTTTALEEEGDTGNSMSPPSTTP
ncbi:MAG: hypothetical protein F4Z75_00265 [Synechococcus sp. SB0668_bin_15]|nr:hypothetical protein [Synechococcus sp. SB0668_bin_15]MYC49835.1 hypothetical protein [Synechococcus sp. SB0662_bin_14]